MAYLSSIYSKLVESQNGDAKRKTACIQFRNDFQSVLVWIIEVNIRGPRRKAIELLSASPVVEKIRRQDGTYEWLSFPTKIPSLRLLDIHRFFLTPLWPECLIVTGWHSVCLIISYDRFHCALGVVFGELYLHSEWRIHCEGDDCEWGGS